MRKLLRCCVFCLLPPLALVFGAPRGRDSVSETRSRCLESLRSPSADERLAARLQLLAERRATIDFLTKLAGDPSSDIHIDNARGPAIQLLGKLRASEASEFLVEHVLDQPPGTNVILEDFPLNGFPAARALLEIGEPGVRTILSLRKGNAISDEELLLFAWIIRLHYGPMREEDVGLYRLRRLLEKENAERKAYAEKRGGEFRPSTRAVNLARLIEVYERIEPTDHATWPKPARRSTDPARDGSKSVP